MLHLVLRNVHHCEDLLVTLKYLDSVPALLSLGHVVQDGFLDVGKRVLNNAAECVLRDHLCLALRSLDSLICGFCDTCALQRGYLADFAAKLGGELGNVDLVAVLLYDVHHVDRSHYRNAKLYELCGQVEVTLEVGTVDDVQNYIGALAYKVVSCYYFLKGVG